jgi:polysaccharide export outer membrane protein
MGTQYLKALVASVLCASAGSMLASAEGPAANAAKQAGDYVLGPGDQLLVGCPDVEELGAYKVRIDDGGGVRLPVIGRVQAAHLTAEQLRVVLNERLSALVKRPDVTVEVQEFRSHAISVLGSVAHPGLFQLQGRKSLVEALALAGGVQETAGSVIHVTRSRECGKLPIEKATERKTYTVADVPLASLLEGKRPEDNIVLCAGDTITIPKAELIYVTGQVNKSGGFPLRKAENLTVLQAISLAGGLERTAAPKHARILRAQKDVFERSEIAINLNRIIEGKLPDIRLQPDDILFVPSSVEKRAAVRAIEAAIQLGTGVVIWRR